MSEYRLTVSPADSSTHPHDPVSDRVLDLDDAQLLAERFKLLSDPSRLRIVYALLEGGGALC